MGMRDFTKSGAFVATIFALLVVLLPFALEEIGEATGLFKFSVRKTITGWFSSGSRISRDRPVAPVDWERYRQDLEDFTNWIKGQSVAAISLPPPEVVIDVQEEEMKPERRLWPVPVVSCTAGEPAVRRKGYAFISGFDHPLQEGASILPSDELCGYEILFVGDRSVWFRAVFGDEGETPMGVVKFPEFSRVDGNSIVMGRRKYVARDAFPLASGGWLMVDSFIPPVSAVFKLLDENRRVVASILCVVIGEKGGR